MKTTTVRFDSATMDDIKRRAEELEIADAEFIRGAVHQRLGRLVEVERTIALEHEVVELRRKVEGLRAAVRRIAAALPGRQRCP